MSALERRIVEAERSLQGALPGQHDAMLRELEDALDEARRQRETLPSSRLSGIMTQLRSLRDRMDAVIRTVGSIMA